MDELKKQVLKFLFERDRQASVFLKNLYGYTEDGKELELKEYIDEEQVFHNFCKDHNIQLYYGLHAMDIIGVPEDTTYDFDYEEIIESLNQTDAFPKGCFSRDYLLNEWMFDSKDVHEFIYRCYEEIDAYEE